MCGYVPSTPLCECECWMPRRPTSQEPSNNNKSATKQPQQQQNTASGGSNSKKIYKKNCHANDSRVIVYRIVVVSSLPLVHVVVYCLLACAHTTKPICCRLNSSALAFTRPERHTILCWGAHSSFSHDVRFSFASCDSRLWRVICCLFRLSIAIKAATSNLQLCLQE